MSISLMNRRQFMTLPLGLVLAPFVGVDAEPIIRRGQYAADVGVLYDMLTFHLEGTIEESVDRAAGQYRYSWGRGLNLQSAGKYWALW